MKRIVAWILAALMILSLTAVFASCKGNDTETGGKETATDQPAESRTESASESVTEEGTHEHTPVTDPAKEATCTESGLTEGIHCSECGEILVAQQEVPAKGHTPDEKAFCTEDQLCTVCGEVVRPATTHTNEVTARKDPTCTEGGYIEYTCKVCGLQACGSSDPLGHNLSGNRHTGTDGKQYVTCSRCGEEIAVTDEEAARLAEIAESILGERLRIVAYVTPDKDSPYLIEQYNMMLAAGINTSVVDGLDSSNGMWLYLDAANETGMDLLADSTSCYNNPEYVVNRLAYLDEEEHIIGLYLRDEPYPFWFGLIGETAAALREEYPDSGWIMAANLLGWGNPAYIWNGVWQDGTEEITTFGKFNPDGTPATDENGFLMFADGKTAAAMHHAMEEYMETVKPDYLCFDVYPFYGGGADFPDYVGHLAFFQYYALQNDIPMWSFLQTCFDYSREQLRCESNLTLAAGAKTLLCFTWEQMINKQNEISPCYDIAKQVFNGIHTMKGVYLDYDIDSYVIVTKNERYREELVEREMEEMLVESYAELVNVESEGEIFVGCGKNAEGKTGLYVVNMSFKKKDPTSAVTLTLTGETAYRLWGDTEGLEAEGVTDRFLLTLEPGEGCFIELNP